MLTYGIPHAIATLIGVCALAYQITLVAAAKPEPIDIAGVALATIAIAALPALAHAAWHWKQRLTSLVLWAAAGLLIVWVTPQGIARMGEPTEQRRMQAQTEAKRLEAAEKAQERATAAFDAAARDMARACADGNGPRCKGAQAVLAERRETLRASTVPASAISVAPWLPAEHAASLLIGLDLTIWACFFFALAPFSRPVAITERDLREEPITEDELDELRRIHRPKTKIQAERDIVTLIGMGRPIGSQEILALRWGVSKGTVSKWLADWERRGLLRRTSIGTRKSVTRCG